MGVRIGETGPPPAGGDSSVTLVFLGGYRKVGPVRVIGRVAKKGVLRTATAHPAALIGGMAVRGMPVADWPNHALPIARLPPWLQFVPATVQRFDLSVLPTATASLASLRSPKSTRCRRVQRR